MAHKRRHFVKGLGTVSIAGVAGCLDSLGGGDGGGGVSNGEDPEWPPDRNLVEIAVATDPGGLIDVLARTWLGFVEEEWPDDVTGSVTNRPEADGILLANELMNDYPRDGGALGGARINSMVTNQVGAEEANFDVRELDGFAVMSQDTRALQFNPRTTPVEDHFEMEWEEFQELAEERTLQFPYSNAAQHVFAQYVRANDPVLNEDNWQFVEVDGGSEARAAIERGDLDGYFGSYVSNYAARNEAYYTQFVFTDPDTEFYEDIADTEPETAPTADNITEKTLRENDQAIILNANNFPEEAAMTAITLVQDSHMLYLPPNVPDDITQIHEDAWGAAADSEELAEAVADAFSEEDHNPLIGDEARAIVEEKYNTFIDNDEVRTLIEEEVY